MVIGIVYQINYVRLIWHTVLNYGIQKLVVNMGGVILSTSRHPKYLLLLITYIVSTSQQVKQFNIPLMQVNPMLRELCLDKALWLI